MGAVGNHRQCHRQGIYRPAWRRGIGSFRSGQCKQLAGNGRRRVRLSRRHLGLLVRIPYASRTDTSLPTITPFGPTLTVTVSGRRVRGRPYREVLMKIRSALFLLLTSGLLFLALYAEAADLGQFGGGDGRGDTMAEVVRLFGGGDGRGDAMAEILNQTMNSITVTSPNGGESWTVGTSHNITWTSTGTVGNVNIDYSTQQRLATGNPVVSQYGQRRHLCLDRSQYAVDDLPGAGSGGATAIRLTTATRCSPSSLTRPRPFPAPTTPTGPATGSISTSYAYSTGGSTSSLGHAVQYKFDWDDGSDSGWLAVGTTRPRTAGRPPAPTMCGPWRAAPRIRPSSRCGRRPMPSSSPAGLRAITTRRPAG